MVFFSIVVDESESFNEQRRSTVDQIASLGTALLGSPAIPPDDETLLRGLDQIRQSLSGHDKLIPIVEELRLATLRVAHLSAAIRHPAETDASPPDEAQRQAAIDVLVSVEQRLLSEVAAIPDRKLPNWVARVIPLLPWVWSWLILFAVVAVYEALRIRVSLSRPLAALAEAAAKVSQGAFDTPMPVRTKRDEIHDLGASVGSMRDRLVELIRQLDQQNKEREIILDNLNEGVLLVDQRGFISQQNPHARRLLSEVAGERQRPGATLRELLPDLPVGFPPQPAALTIEVTQGRPERRRSFDISASGVIGGDSSVVLIRETTHLLELERMKQEFLSVVTHELKTPLTAIEGYAKLLDMGKGGTLSDRQRSFVGTIREQTASLLSMIHDLLDVTRLEAQVMVIESRPILASELLQAAASALAGTIEQAGLQLKVNPGNLEQSKVLADQVRIQQVLSNLIGNAIKFTPSGGEISLSGARDGNQVNLVVSDSGRGIPGEQLSRIFDKFYQVEAGDDRVVGGAGLGLYISRLLVEAQGGSIEVTSTVGVGSIFTVHLPLFDEAMTGQPAGRRRTSLVRLSEESR
jgi:signal transduction histidine kinase